MDINHGNLYNELLALVLGHYGVGNGRGERGRERGKEQKWMASVGGTGTGKWRDRRNHGGQRGEEYEKDTLVGDVQEYWGFYSGEGTDTVWDL